MSTKAYYPINEIGAENQVFQKHVLSSMHFMETM